MLKIKLKTLFSIYTAKTLIFISNLCFNGGSNFPGRVALKLDRNVLKTAAKGYKTIIVTGTNGKTTTTSMICGILTTEGKSLITNNTGANMLPGIVSCYIRNFSFKNKDKEVYAIIETDEANVKLVTEMLSPEIITITNLFRDQLDRYGEVYTTLKKIMEGVSLSPSSTLVLNGDESLLGKLDVPNNKIYYGFNSPVNDNKEIDINADAKFCVVCKAPYKYNFITYNHLGDFYCENCGYKRPQLKYHVDQIISKDSKSSEVLFNSKNYYISQSGTYNIYNALCAYSVARELDISENIIETSLKEQKSSFGRQEEVCIDNKKVKIILVKNPAGYNEALDSVILDNSKVSLGLLLNDNYADGRDVSWIWDVNFEKIVSMNLSRIMVGGIRLFDMALRVETAGIEENFITLCEDYEKLLDSIKDAPSEKVYILATYTAMISFRKFLHSKGYIKKIW